MNTLLAQLKLHYFLNGVVDELAAQNNAKLRYPVVVTRTSLNAFHGEESPPVGPFGERLYEAGKLAKSNCYSCLISRDIAPNIDALTQNRPVMKMSITSRKQGKLPCLLSRILHTPDVDIGFATTYYFDETTESLP